MEKTCKKLKLQGAKARLLVLLLAFCLMVVSLFGSVVANAAETDDYDFVVGSFGFSNGTSFDSSEYFTANDNGTFNLLVDISYSTDLICKIYDDDLTILYSENNAIYGDDYIVTLSNDFFSYFDVGSEYYCEFMTSMTDIYIFVNIGCISEFTIDSDDNDSGSVDDTTSTDKDDVSNDSDVELEESSEKDFTYYWNLVLDKLCTFFSSSYFVMSIAALCFLVIVFVLKELLKKDQSVIYAEEN